MTAAPTVCAAKAANTRMLFSGIDLNVGSGPGRDSALRKVRKSPNMRQIAVEPPASIRIRPISDTRGGAARPCPHPAHSLLGEPGYPDFPPRRSGGERDRRKGHR